MKKILLILFLPYTLFSQNNFENGVSPSTYRYFTKNKFGNYNRVIIQTEGFDAINYFGNRLKDINLDGSVDIVMRAKEYLEGEWDIPSTNPRKIVKLNLDNSFNPNLIVDDKLISDGEKVKYYEKNDSLFFYSFWFGDPTIINQIGIDDYKGYFQQYDYFEGDDYFCNDIDCEFIPRLYSISNGVITDITKENLIISDELKFSNAKYVWDQARAYGDFDGDGDTDILISATHYPGSNPALSDINKYNRHQLYIFENLGNGKLKWDIIEFEDFPENQSFKRFWFLEEGAKLFSLNLDSDTYDEILVELRSYDIENPPTNISYDEAGHKRELGYFNVDILNKKVEFIKLLDEDEFLFNKEWSVYPKDIKDVSFLNQNKELLLFFYSSKYGSHPTKTDGSQPWADNDYMQYFRIYEKVFEGNNYSLIDVTNIYFNDNESKTLSLDNSGTIHLIDIDKDGDLDLYPQLGQHPNSKVGGINRFASYPNWIGNESVIYFFKNDNNKYILSSYDTIIDYGLSNFDGDFSNFNDNGEHLGNNRYYLENFTSLNLYSLNDLDNDSNFELITASNPDYIKIYSKSNIISKSSVNGLQNIFVSHQEFSPNFSFEPYMYDFDLNNFYLPKDSVLRKFDKSFDRVFVVDDTISELSVEELISNIGIDLVVDKSKIYDFSLRYDRNQKFSDTHSYIQIKKIGFSPLSGQNTNDKNIWESDNYIFSTYLRNDDDILVDTHEFTFYEKNYPPLPFKITDYKPINENNNKYVEITFSNSVDINLNSHPYDGSYNVYNIGYLNVETDSLPGLHYGFELYNKEDQSLILSSLSQDYSYNKILENDVVRSYVTMKIDISSYDINNIYIKIFALDTEESNVRTYAFSDVDNDGVLDPNDNCILSSNADQLDTDGDGIGDVCDTDDDGDGVEDSVDNCPLSANADQLDTDGDGIGDVCDTDDDGDGVEDSVDNCPLSANADQLDTDGDGIGDVCDTDDDGDGVEDKEDNCPLTANPDQADWNNNGVGDVCGDPKPLSAEKVTFVENIYPNPTDDKLTVSIRQGIKIKDIYFVDFSGKTIKPKSVSRGGDNLEINVSNLNEGMYILEIVSDKEVDKVKVVIER